MKLAARMLCGSLLAIFLAPPPAWGQFERSVALAPADVDLLDATSATHLENAKRFLAEKQWDEAVDAIRRAMEGDASRLIRVAQPGEALPEGFERLISVREFCQWRLSALAKEAPEALAHYRSLADPLAEQWFRSGVASRDERLLRRIVQEAFATKVGDDALLWLGDAALERGEFAQARGYYDRIGPNLRVPTSAAALLQARPGSSVWLALQKLDLGTLWPQLEPLLTGDYERFVDSYPDTDLSPAVVRARLVLASILEGDSQRAKVELALFRRLHGDTAGELTGRQGVLVDLLTGVLNQSSSWPPVRSSADWPTFAGNQARCGRAEGEIDPAGKALWAQSLPRLQSDRDVVGAGRLRVADDMKGLLSYFPVVIRDTVLLRVDARGKSYVAAFDLRSGQRRWQVDAPRSPGRHAADEDPDAPWEVSDGHTGLLRHVGVARYTLTVHGHKLFVRMGSPVTAPPARKLERVLAKEQGYLMGYDLATEGKPLEGFPIRPESNEWSFEGTPVCDGANLYVAMRRVEQGRCQLHVACFGLQTGGADADDSQDDSRPGGHMKWRTKLCSASTLGGGDLDELSHLLLALDSSTIFANTNMGVVAAIDADSGQARWLCRYPRAPFRSGDPDRHDDNFFRDLTPCMPAGDLVIAAPADCDRLFALDRTTGSLVWMTAPGEAADVVHLLGTSGDWLIAGGDRLYWIDRHSGRVQVRFPGTPSSGPMQAAPNPRGFGRGILAGNKVYWPTRESIFVFQQSPRETEAGFVPEGVREIPLVPRGATGGNLVFSRGTLLIAAGDKLYAFDAGPRQAAGAAAGKQRAGDQ